MSNQVFKRTREVSLCAALFLAAAPAGAVTFKPKGDDEVLEVLPRRTAAFVPAELRALHERLRADPKNLTLATGLAAKLIDLGREAADPRAYGQAEAALAPWWQDPAPPAEVRVLRAAILQFNHRFAEALVDLDQYLKERPDDPSARLMQATVATVTADYPLAKAACDALQIGREVIVKLACAAGVASLEGDPAAPLAKLSALYAYMTPTDPKLRAWVLGTLGDMAARGGRPADAERYLREALTASPGDLFAAVTLSDVWLGEGKNADVLALLKERTDQDALLLRLTLAEKRLSDPAAAAHARVLAGHFAAEKERGSRPHRREEAYFALYVLENKGEAAALARANWSEQKEPIDRRLLAEAAGE